MGTDIMQRSWERERVAAEAEAAQAANGAAIAAAPDAQLQNAK